MSDIAKLLDELLRGGWVWRDGTPWSESEHETCEDMVGVARATMDNLLDETRARGKYDLFCDFLAKYGGRAP